MSIRADVSVLKAAGVGIALGLLVGCGQAPPDGQTTTAPGPASAEQKGGQDQTGPYAVVENWPKPMSESLADHEGKAVLNGRTTLMVPLQDS